MERDEGETKPLLVKQRRQETSITRMYTMSDNSEEATPILPENGTSHVIENSQHISNEDDPCKESKTTSYDNESNSQDEDGKSSNRNRILGVVLVIMAGMSFTGGNVIQKFVVPEVTFWQLLFTRALVQTTITGAACLIMHHKFGSGMAYLFNNLMFHSTISNNHPKCTIFLFREFKDGNFPWSKWCSSKNSDSRPSWRNSSCGYVHCNKT